MHNENRNILHELPVNQGPLYLIFPHRPGPSYCRQSFCQTLTDVQDLQ